MKQFIINEDLVIALLQYLQTKPYSEVVVGIQQLQQLKEIKHNDENKKMESEIK